MATVRHAFESAKDDPADATLIGASEWNDAGAHVVEGFDLPYINVMDPAYGTVGDGVADDTASIQAAYGTGKRVWFPEGVYKFSSTLVVPTGAHWEGAAARDKDASSGGVKLLYTGTGTAIKLINTLNARLENFQLACTGAGAIGMEFADPANLTTVENVLFIGPASGSGIGLLMHGQISSVSHNTFINCYLKQWDDAIRLSGFANANYFVNGLLGVCSTGINLTKYGSDTTAGTDNVFERFELDGGTTKGITIADTASRNVFIKCQCDGVTNGYSIADDACVYNTFITCLLNVGTVSDASTTTVYLGCAEIGLGGLQVGGTAGSFVPVNALRVGAYAFTPPTGGIGVAGDVRSQGIVNAAYSGAGFTSVGAVGPGGEPGIWMGNPRDTRAYRVAAGSFKTDGQFTAADGLVGKYVAGAGKTNLADGDFTVTPANGATGVAHNTTDGKSYYCARANGTWKSVEVA